MRNQSNVYNIIETLYCNTTMVSDTSTKSPDVNYESVFKVFSIVIRSLAFLLGTTGNGLVIWFTLFKMKKTVNVVWFLNLAIADFIFTFFLPFKIISIALNNQWPFGNFMCRFTSTLFFFNLYASVFLLTVISIDRCISVMFPVWCQNRRNTRLGIVVVLFVWVLAFIFSIAHFIFRNTICVNGKWHCKMDFGKGTSAQRDTIIVRSFFGFFIPFIIMISCYTVIALHIKRNHTVKSTKPFKIILAVIICFFVCWFPYHLFSILKLFTKSETFLSSVQKKGFQIASSLAFINSCINPILYVFIVRDFKQKFWISIQSTFEKAFKEDSVQKEPESQTKSTINSLLV